jgi:hypothetical protein
MSYRGCWAAKVNLQSLVGLLPSYNACNSFGASITRDSLGSMTCRNRFPLTNRTCMVDMSHTRSRNGVTRKIRTQRGMYAGNLHRMAY